MRRGRRSTADQRGTFKKCEIPTRPCDEEIGTKKIWYGKDEKGAYMIRCGIFFPFYKEERCEKAYFPVEKK